MPTKEQDQSILKMLRRGNSAKSVAKTLGVSATYVNRLRDTHGIPRLAPCRATPITPEEVAARTREVLYGTWVNDRGEVQHGRFFDKVVEEVEA